MVDTSTVGLSLAALLALAFAYKKLKKKRRKVWPKDTVVLHQVGRGPRAPSLSPFPVKLETYLRIAKIPYINDHKDGMSSKGKTPWISYNDEDVSDTQFCMEYLNKKFDIDLSSHLNRQQRAVACAFQRLADEHLYWCNLLWRWKYDESGFLQNVIQHVLKYRILSILVFKIVKRKCQKQAYGQGMGRHSYEEYLKISEADLAALSDFLGDKKYLMGDTVCEQDCSMFGQLTQIVTQMDNSPLNKLVHEKFPNLRDYVYRMRDEFWPDWDECNTCDCTKEAAK